MKRKLFGYLKTNRQGIALISVLGVVTLATILILALFSVSDAEFKASRVYADGNQARQLADMAVNIVTSQIQSAATGAGTNVTPTVWASQPGAVRVYNSGGSFILGRKLYSSEKMVEVSGGLAGETLMAEDFPSANWNEQPAEWVDLNPGITKVTSGASGAGSTTYFPIIDPVASVTALGNEPIEGFSYSSVGTKGTSLPGVTNPEGGAGGSLPMPVQWLYVLKDGNVGTVQQTKGSPTASWRTAVGSVQPTVDNPIIGRVGFWTDDESCKININTAGEPSFYALPTVFHDRDAGWGSKPPATFEYQRFPGHPATVALSSVLFPNPTHSTTNYDGDSYPSYSQSYLNLKNAIYELTPKLGLGGSQDGTLAFDVDDFSSKVTADYNALSANRKASGLEHLYTSADEWIYDKTKLTDGLRQKVSIGMGGGDLVDEVKILRARPFLTASSRSSELNMFGLPRIAIWPVSDETLGRNFRTGYDDTIAETAGLGKGPGGGAFHPNSYIFRRYDSQSALVDMGSSGIASPGLRRNAELMNYLDKMLAVTMPGGGSFNNKYGVQDSRQILVEIFDYIRCTNLYDAYLDEKYITQRGGRDYLDDNSPAATGAKPYTGSSLQMDSKLWNETPAQFSYYTYTAPRFDTVRRVGDLVDQPPDQFKNQFNKGVKEERVTVGAYPGHGQVRPIEWTVGGSTYKGFGRFPTISEVALQFICTGDGYTGTDQNPDPGAYKLVKNGTTIRSGGKTAQRIDPEKNWDENQERVPLWDARIRDRKVPTFWYSNIPPFPGRALFEKWGCDFNEQDTRSPRHPSNHPGWNPFNWNCTLDSDPVNGGIELEQDEKRVQAAIQLELFVPSVGYTKITPDFTIVLNGTQLSGLQVQDGKGRWLSLFSSTADQVIQSTPAYWNSRMGEHPGSGNVSPMGGNYGSSPLMSGRQAKAIGRMPKDPSYNDAATSDIHSGMLNFPLVSNPFTVKRGRDARIKFRVPKEAIRADIYDSHDWQGLKDPKHRTPVQSVMIKIPGAETLKNKAPGDEAGTHSTPVPRLVVYSSDRRKYTVNGNTTEMEAIHACRWWAFNNWGALGRYRGEPVKGGGGPLGINYNAVTERTPVNDSGSSNLPSGTWGRFHDQTRSSIESYDGTKVSQTKHTVPTGTRIYGYSPVGPYTGVRSKEENLGDEDKATENRGGMVTYGYWGSDSVRSIMPRHGDYRILAARKIVTENIWQLHPIWQVNPEALFAHSLTGFRSDAEVGVDAGYEKTVNGVSPTKLDPALRLVSTPNDTVKGAWYPTTQVPDTPLTTEAAAQSSIRRDFDNAPGNFRDGPYINKADDGNLSVAQFWYGSAQQFYQTRNAYFLDSFLQMPSKNAFFTPNRMLTGPGMFGSLPTGVFGSAPLGDSNPTVDGVPWRTLLFRPNTAIHAGALPPADHNILDLFWMPVVEPYAISDSFATAGKLNINFAMVPFSHIKRSTGMHAAMKGELLTVLSKNDGTKPGNPSQANTLAYKSFRQANTTPKTYWSETTAGGNKQWHRQIDINETVKHMNSRLTSAPGVPAAEQGLFRTASQICEVHLIPKAPTVPVLGEPNLKVNTSALKGTMNTFWNVNAITGDNTRERPYTNLYQKVTTRSNTFRVHFVAQTLKKARSVAPDQVDESRDSVTAEYRGSALLERFLDFTNKTFSDYPNYGSMATPFSTQSLESQYRYRVLETKQFLP